MNNRNNSQHGGSMKTEQEKRNENAAWGAVGAAFVATIPTIAAFFSVVVFAGRDGQARLVERGWLVPVADAVVTLPGGVGGLDVARLTLPIGNLLIAMVVGFASLSAYARRDKAAPYWYWQRESLAALVFAVWSAEPLPAVLGFPAVLGWLGAFWCIALAVGIGVLGVRANRRYADRGRLIEQIAPLVGDQIKNRNLIGLARWTQEWPTGIPQKVLINYPNADLEYDPERQGQIITRVSRIGWGPYRLDSTNPRKHQLLLVPGTDPNPKPAAAWPRTWENAR